MLYSGITDCSIIRFQDLFNRKRPAFKKETGTVNRENKAKRREIMYRALVAEKEEDGFKRSVKELRLRDLPDNDTLVRVMYSSLNYKDALSATGNRGVTRKFPHTPGIDAAGVVEETESSLVETGDEVIVTSYDLGMNTPGGFGEYIRVPAEWIVRLPAGLSLKQSMIYGTAGFTAGMSVYELVSRINHSDGEILVTGATGGVGSMAVSILSGLGYSVACVSGKPDAADYLKPLGAGRIIDREEFLKDHEKPLLKETWAGGIDTAGGQILACTVKSAKLSGVVTCCGNAASGDLPLTVFPFILRGVSLAGIDSQHCPMELRQKIWNRLAGDWKVEGLESICTETGLDGLDHYIHGILKGEMTGRVVVKVCDD